jgi:hypothetical protein
MHIAPQAHSAQAASPNWNSSTVLVTVGDLPLKQCADELLQIEKLPTHDLAQLGAVGDAHTPLVISADE